MDSIIVIATYNERQSLPILVEQIRERMKDAHLLIVDDNSPDGTGRWVREQSRVDPQIQLLHREKKLGLGAATIAGIQHALKSQPEWIMTMDADLSHRPADLVKLWQAAANGQFDVIIGSRYVPGGRIEHWGVSRRIASRSVNWFARWGLWLSTRDNSSAFRVYRSSMLQKLDLSQIDCQGFAYLEQILVHLKRFGARFCEIPIVFKERELGKSKVTTIELVRNLRDISMLAIKRR